MDLEQPDRNHNSLLCKLSEHEVGSVLFTAGSSVSVKMTGALLSVNERVKDLSDELSFDVSDSTKKNTIPEKQLWKDMG